MLGRLLIRKRPSPNFVIRPPLVQPPGCLVLPSTKQHSSSTSPTPALKHVSLVPTDNDNEERAADLREERTALGKALLDPAWMHGRRALAAPPVEGLDRINDVSRLLSGRQIRLHASRLNRSKRESGLATERSRRPLKLKDGGLQEEEDAGGESGESIDKGTKNKSHGPKYVKEEKTTIEGHDAEEERQMIEGESEKPGYTIRKPAWTGRVASPPEALAYLSTRSLLNFSINLRVLRDVAVAARSPLFASSEARPRSFLDVGCGPGSALLAAHTLWPDIPRLDGVDHSQAMRDLTKHVVETGGKDQDGRGDRLVLHRHLPPLLAQSGRSQLRFDVVFASWTLSELPSDASRALATSIMWELVAENGGFLVVVEDGSPEGSRLVRSVRKLVLEGGDPGTQAGTTGPQARARTVGPCQHDRPCPLPREEWCRFSQRIPIGRLHRRIGKPGSGYKDVAFSYTILKKLPGTGEDGEGDKEGRKWGDARLEALHRLRYGDSGKGEEDGAAYPYRPKDRDWEVALLADPGREGWGRLIRNPKKKKGHVHLDLCTPAGELERVMVAKRATRTLPGKYMAARKAQWGGLWPFPDV